MSIYEELASANRAYAAGFTKGGLPMPPARKLAVVACMDARLDPAKALGLEEGDAHVIRNAGRDLCFHLKGNSYLRPD